MRSPRTLVKKIERLRPLFSVCSEEGIRASELWRFPLVIEKVAGNLYESAGSETLFNLHDVWTARDLLGFSILDEAGLKQLSGLITERSSIQTAYIPPRIWTYQVLRLHEALKDYLAHTDAVEACYRFCLEAYAVNAGGSLSKAFGPMKTGQLPFNPANQDMVARGSRVFYGAFRHTAERFGIAELLSRWVNTSDQAGIRSLSSYLTMISQVAFAYVLNFSLMRSDECANLRGECHSIERDAVGEDIHLIGGPTTKTIQDDDARWIVSPSVELAIRAARSVAGLRMEAARHHPSSGLTLDQLENPVLQCWAYEPWGGSAVRTHRKKVLTYAEVVTAWPRLIDPEQLRVTSTDFEIANRMTMGLDPDEFGVGKVWPLAWHQLRRTGAVNMLASGQVSEASLQYQLKHASRAMTRYYGQNHYRLNSRLDDETRGFYLREMYQSLVREFQRLRDDNHISPHGAKRKDQILAPIAEKDHAGLLKSAKAGKVAYRETFLGGCANPGAPCKLGGFSNITGCMGFGEENACEFAIIDRQKRNQIVTLRDLHATQLKGSERGSPAWEFHQAQMESAERALNVIDQV